MQDKVRFIGPVDNPRPLYRYASIVVNSRRGLELFGLSIIEAMMMATPVLALAQGGPKETVVDGKNGWLIEEASIDGFYLGLRRALNDQSLWPEMARNARAHACSNFSS